MRSGIDWQYLIQQCNDLLSPCRLCPRQCKIDRRQGKTGFCGAGAVPYIFKDFVHYGEEAALVPSHTIYMTGCNLRCAFCSNYRCWDELQQGRRSAPADDATIIDHNFSNGSRNVNFLGGEPTVNLPGILRILERVNPNIPVVWNSNLYATPEAFSIIAQFADVYLADFKFGNDSCARQIAESPDYVATITRNLKTAAANGKVIVRHLPLTGHEKCCSRPVIEWVAKHLPTATISLLDNYIPARNCGLQGGTNAELQALRTYIKECGLKEEPMMPVSERTSFRLAGNHAAALETEIFVGKDGSIYFQDLDGNLLNVADRLMRPPSDT